jgi:putative FmdB family regulatory protein
MPIYEYRCGGCEKVFEALRPLGDDGRELSCPKCGRKRPEKIFSVFAAASSHSSSGPGPCGQGGGGGGCAGTPFRSGN